MAERDGTVVIDTEINTEAFEEFLKTFETKTAEVGNVAEELGSNISEPVENKVQGLESVLGRVSGSMTKLGSTLSLAFTEPLTALGSQMVSSSSDLEENINKVDVAFGSSAENVKAWAEIATESFGLSKNQALEAAALFGDMGTSMGIPQEEAANMATSLSGLAGDLASFKNIGIDQAMTALNGVFTGETESLKTLGVVMTQTNLEEFAKKTGKVYDEMSQAEKVQLRYAYVLETTQNAQGDYARTSDGTANSMRTLSASIDNLVAAFGQHLLPIITPIIQFVTDIISKFGEMDPAIQKIIVGVGLVVAAIGPVITAIGGVISAISTVLPIIGGIGSILNPVTLIIGAVVAAIALLITHWDDVKAAMQTFIEFVKEAFEKDWTESFGVFGNVINLFFDNVKEVWELIKDIFDGIITFVTGVFTGNWKKAWDGIGKIFSGVKDYILSIVGNIQNFLSQWAQWVFNALLAKFTAVKDAITNIFASMGNAIKNRINDIIYVINRMISGVVDGINSMIGALNGLSFSVPSWVPGIGGSTFGLNIGYVNAPQIPYLATGAVIPPNAPFVAMLGDQKHGKNIEAPEELIRKIVREEAGGGSRGGQYQFIAQLNRRTLFSEMIEEAKLSQVRSGRNPFCL